MTCESQTSRPKHCSSMVLGGNPAHCPHCIPVMGLPHCRVWAGGSWEGKPELWDTESHGLQRQVSQMGIQVTVHPSYWKQHVWIKYMYWEEGHTSDTHTLKSINKSARKSGLLRQTPKRRQKSRGRSNSCNFYPEALCRTRETWALVFRIFKRAQGTSPVFSQVGNLRRAYPRSSWDFQKIPLSVRVSQK